MQNAIIAQDKRISSIMSVPQPDGGIMLVPATAQEYYTFEKENGPWDKGQSLKSFEEMRLVLRHRATLWEIFDSVWVDVPFKCTHLVGELSTISHLSEKTQYCIINALCRWMTIQEIPQCQRRGGSFVLARA